MSNAGYDTTLADLVIPSSSKLEYNIPLIDDFRSESSVSLPDLFILTGKPQTYKTTLAVDMLKKLIEIFPDYEAIWLDCDLKFPKYTIRQKKIDTSKLKYIECRSTEEILFALQKIEFYIDQDNIPVNTLVIDGLNSSFWIDSASILKKNIFYQTKYAIERIVSKYGLTCIVILQDLGDFQLWSPSPMCSTQIIKCNVTEAGKGFITTGEFCDQFIVDNNREFLWGKRTVVSHEMKFNQPQQQQDVDENQEI